MKKTEQRINFLTFTKKQIWLPAYINIGNKRKRLSKIEVSSFGNVRDSKTKKKITPELYRTGYYILPDTNTVYPIYIHRIVASTFLENDEGCQIVNHIDENKLNNRLENLEWVDNEYNTYWSSTSREGSKQWNKMVEAQQQLKNNIPLVFNSPTDQYVFEHYGMRVCKPDDDFWLI